jgi:hypothetical protein
MAAQLHLSQYSYPAFHRQDSSYDLYDREDSVRRLQNARVPLRAGVMCRGDECWHGS